MSTDPLSHQYEGKCHSQVSQIDDSTDPLTYTVVTFKYIFFVHILLEDGHRSGPKHVVVVHNKIEHE
jgi:hypothetical protein